MSSRNRDIPEFPFIVDRYKNQFVIYDKSQRIDEEKNHLPLVIEALKNIFKVDEASLIIKRRQVQKGNDQYQKLNPRGDTRNCKPATADVSRSIRAGFENSAIFDFFTYPNGISTFAE